MGVLVHDRLEQEMDSHEEKLHLMIKQSKMDSAKDQAARQAKAIRERQREQVRPQPALPMRALLCGPVRGRLLHPACTVRCGGAGVGRRGGWVVERGYDGRTW